MSDHQSNPGETDSFQAVLGILFIVILVGLVLFGAVEKAKDTPVVLPAVGTTVVLTDGTTAIVENHYDDVQMSRIVNVRYLDQRRQEFAYRSLRPGEYTWEGESVVSTSFDTWKFLLLLVTGSAMLFGIFAFLLRDQPKG